MKNKKIGIKLLGIVLCFITFISLININGLSFFQGLMLKATLTVCPGIFLSDIIDYIKER